MHKYTRRLSLALTDHERQPGIVEQQEFSTSDHVPVYACYSKSYGSLLFVSISLSSKDREII